MGSYTPKVVRHNHTTFLQRDVILVVKTLQLDQRAHLLED